RAASHCTTRREASTHSQSRDNLAQDAVCLVNREPHCRSNTTRLVFYEMNQALGDQWAPVVNANNAVGSLSGARCQSVASEACTFPGYTIGGLKVSTAAIRRATVEAHVYDRMRLR
ncbi:hypothetical protein JOQ06_015048, partial [Pogonophryne albipinna]